MNQSVILNIVYSAENNIGGKISSHLVKFSKIHVSTNIMSNRHLRRAACLHKHYVEQTFTSGGKNWAMMQPYSKNNTVNTKATLNLVHACLLSDRPTLLCEALVLIFHHEWDKNVYK